MPAPDCNGTKESLQLVAKYWEERAMEPCRKCAIREREIQQQNEDLRLRKMIREEMEKAGILPIR